LKNENEVNREQITILLAATSSRWTIRAID